MRDCMLCGLPTGRPRSAWHRACRRRAERRWAAGLPADAYPQGARRGRVPLGSLTRLEQQLQEQREQAYQAGWRDGVEEALRRALPALRRLR